MWSSGLLKKLVRSSVSSWFGVQGYLVMCRASVANESALRSDIAFGFPQPAEVSNLPNMARGKPYCRTSIGTKRIHWECQLCQNRKDLRLIFCRSFRYEQVHLNDYLDVWTGQLAVPQL